MERSEQPTRLPAMKVIIGAFLMTWALRKKLALALIYPSICLVLLTLVPYFSGNQLSTPVSWLVDLFYLMISCIFAVTCHRIVLLDAPSSFRSSLHWTRRETRFLGWALLIAMFFVLAIFILITFATLSGVNISAIKDPGNNGALTAVLILMAIPVVYVSARLSLIFPATALDRKHDLRWAWKQSHGNGWRLAIVVGGLPFIFSQLLGLFIRENATIFETVFLAIAGVIVVAIEVIALSLAYRELIKDIQRDEIA
jgi:membrane-anchored glycerophosphoryl diester phosphodiesterase (GDPDase)